MQQLDAQLFAGPSEVKTEHQNDITPMDVKNDNKNDNFSRLVSGVMRLSADTNNEYARRTSTLNHQ